MNDEIFMNHIGISIQAWLNFISSVGRDFILSERSIKVPLAEFVSARFSNVNSINLEFPHPTCAQKRLDLHCTKVIPVPRELGFEFKYVKKDSTLSTK